MMDLFGFKLGEPASLHYSEPKYIEGTEPKDGATITYGDYKYSYVGNDSLEYYGYKSPGWQVSLDDDNCDKEYYGQILSEIGGKPVIAIDHLFADCDTLKRSPKIPDTVKYMESAFAYCSSLVEAPEIPQGVVSMRQAFQCCEALEKGPTIIPSSVKDLTFAFAHCTKLHQPPVFSNNAAFIYESNGAKGCFVGCPFLLSPEIIITFCAEREEFLSYTHTIGTIFLNGYDIDFDYSTPDDIKLGNQQFLESMKCDENTIDGAASLEISLLESYSKIIYNFVEEYKQTRYNLPIYSFEEIEKLVEA